MLWFSDGKNRLFVRVVRTYALIPGVQIYPYGHTRAHAHEHLHLHTHVYTYAHIHVQIHTLYTQERRNKTNVHTCTKDG